MKNKQALIFILILLLIALVSIAWLSTFTRLYADDYCIGADAQQLNLQSFFQKWYSSWTGRFSYIILTWFLAPGGARLAALLPSISLGIWLLVITWALLPSMRHYWADNPILPSLTFGALIILLVIRSTPNLFQSFFWRDGLINYTFPLIGLTIIAGFLSRCWLETKFSVTRLFFLFLISFASGGFSEVFSVMQLAIYGMLILIVVFTHKADRKRTILWALISSLAGALIALLLVLIAPGNAVRQSLLAAHPGFFRLVTFSMRNALFIAAKFFIQTPGWAFITIIASIWVGLSIAHAESNHQVRLQPTPANWLTVVMLIPVTTYIIMVAACAPVVYMLNAYPDERTILLPVFILIIGIIFSVVKITTTVYHQGFMKNLLQKLAINRWLRVAFIASIFVAALLVTYGSIQKLPDYQHYTATWEARDKELRSPANQGSKQVTVPGLESRFGLSDLQTEEDFWVNRCMADFYQIPIIIGR